MSMYHGDISKLTKKDLEIIRRPMIVCGKSLTKNSFLEETNINKMVARFRLAGVMPDVGPQNFADVSDVAEYQASLNSVREADRQFALLPASIRERFQNDPEKLLEFFSNKKNLAEARKLGLVAMLEPKKPKVEPATPANKTGEPEPEVKVPPKPKAEGSDKEAG